MSRKPRRDAGFTLTEVVLVVGMMGIIAAVIGTAITVSLRNLPATTSRADSAVLVQGLTTFLPPDVDSTTPDAFNADPSATSGCPGGDPAGSKSMLKLTWNEKFRNDDIDFVANYRVVEDAKSMHIVRVFCKGDGALGNTTSIRMTGPLAKVTPTVTVENYAVTKGLDGADPSADDDYVVITVKTLEGENIRIEAATKDPNDDLGYGTGGSGTPPPNSAPWVSDWNINAAPLLPRTFKFPAGDIDGDVITGTITSASPQLSVTAAGDSFTVQVLATATLGATYGFGYQVTDPDGATASAVVTVEVVAVPTPPDPPGTPIPPPCQVSGVTTNPSVGELHSSGKLKKNVVVTANVGAGYCVGLHLAYETGGQNGEHILNFGETSPYTVTLLGNPHGTELWSAGTHVLYVKDGSNNVLFTKNFVVNP